MEVWSSHFLVSSTLEKMFSFPFNKSIVQLVVHAVWVFLTAFLLLSSSLPHRTQCACSARGGLGMWASGQILMLHPLMAFLSHSAFSQGWDVVTIMKGLNWVMRSPPFLQISWSSTQIMLKTCWWNQEISVLFIHAFISSFYFRRVHLNTYNMVLDTKNYRHKSENCLTLKQLHSSLS